MVPELVIKRGRLLEPVFRAYIEREFPDFEFPSDEEVDAKIVQFREEWNKYSPLFFKGLSDMGLEFSRNRIEVLILPATNRDMSSPLIVRSRYSPEEFVSVLTHELLHNLFNDIGLVKDYEAESKVTRNHIYVFAMLEFLFKEIYCEPERLGVEQAKSSAEKNADYHRAWQIVQRDGYEKILGEVKHTQRGDRAKCA